MKRGGCRSSQADTARLSEQNPEVQGLGAMSSGNPLGRVSISKPTADDLDRASVVRMK